MASKLKKYIGVEDEEEEPSLKQELSQFAEEVCPSLTYQQRLYGFAICFVVGWFLSFLSVIALAQNDITTFAIIYTFGSVTALCATGFLWGPWKQCKKMFKPIRAWATIMYFVTMILTLVLAFTHQDTLLILLSILLQFLAMCWYCLSYIPYGRKMAKNCAASMCSC